jgi:hypothetical protein
LFLLVNEGFEHLTDHFKVISRPSELVRQIDEVSSCRIEAIGQKARYKPGQSGMSAEKRCCLVNYVDPDVVEGSSSRRVGNTEQNRHFADKRTGLDEHCYLCGSAQNFNATFDKYIHTACCLTFFYECRPVSDLFDRKITTVIKNGSHQRVLHKPLSAFHSITSLVRAVSKTVHSSSASISTPAVVMR